MRFKGITNASMLGQRGMNAAEKVVLEMGFVWNPIHIESGIDAVIELRDSVTGQTKNRIIQAQVKAVSEFSSEQGDSFSFGCERAHIGYWLGGTAPVILIVCKPASGEIYWKNLKEYFSIPENSERVTVRFSKATDKFDVSLSNRLLALSKPEGGLSLGPLPKIEDLEINLLPLTGYPRQIYATPTIAKARESFNANYYQANKPWLKEYFWEAGIFYSFFEPSEPDLKTLFAKAPSTFPTTDWSQSENPLLERRFSQLLLRTFEQKCFKRGIHLNREEGVFYIALPADGRDVKFTSKSVVNTTTKTLVGRHSSVREDGVDSGYYKHLAFHGRTRRFDKIWYFELTPTHYFSTDGKSPHPNSAALLSGIKRMERHASIFSAFLTLKEFLTEQNLFSASYDFLKINSSSPLAIDRGISDEAWRTVDADLSMETESSEELELIDEQEDSLFLWKPN